MRTDRAEKCEAPLERVRKHRDVRSVFAEAYAAAAKETSIANLT